MATTNFTTVIFEYYYRSHWHWGIMPAAGAAWHWSELLVLAHQHSLHILLLCASAHGLRQGGGAQTAGSCCLLFILYIYDCFYCMLSQLLSAVLLEASSAVTPRLLFRSPRRAAILLHVWGFVCVMQSCVVLQNTLVEFTQV
jgi:hypothetical protein